VTHTVEIIQVDYTNQKQRSAIPYLLNTYAKGLLGFRSEIKKQVLDGLVPGLERMQSAVVLLARTDGEYVGMAICFMGFSTFHAKPLINIHDFMVLEGFRGQGVGRALLGEIETIARDMDCCKMTLEVQENNTSARKLYHSVGFKGSFLNQEAGSQLFMTKHVYSPN
jgi:ribosomal protein S18 acetylase RimI-like enzyme